MRKNILRLLQLLYIVNEKNLEGKRIMIKSVDITDKDNSIIAKLEGEFVAGSLDDFRSKLKEFLSNGVCTLIIDMSGVTAIDSSGSGLLAAAHNSFSKAGGNIRVTGLTKEMYDFLISLRLNSHFKIEQQK